MCGHVGAYGKLSHRAKVMFHWLTHFDMVRGPHSTGIAMVREDNTTEVWKEVGAPAMVYHANQDHFNAPGVVKEDKVKVLMGHNRYKTQGEIDRESAHPFEFEHVIGAHNGTVDLYLNEKLDYGDVKFAIDSQKIFSHLNRNENPQTVWDVLPDERGAAMCLVWWDKRNNTLNIARNNQRPLFFAKVKNENTVMWASEDWMLNLAAGVANLDIEQPYSIKANHHFKFKETEKGMKVDVAPLTPFVRPVVQHHGYSGYTPIKRNVTVTIREECPGTPHYFVLTKPLVEGKPLEEVIVPIIEGVRKQENIDLIHKYVADFGGQIVVNENMMYGQNSQDGLLKLSFYTMEIAIKEAYRQREADEKKIKAEEATTKEEDEADGENGDDNVIPLPSRVVMVSHTGELLQGKALRRAMRAAGNICACCTETLYPSRGAEDAVFISDDMMLCDLCNTPEVLDYLGGLTASTLH